MFSYTRFLRLESGWTPIPLLKAVVCGVVEHFGSRFLHGPSDSWFVTGPHVSSCEFPDHELKPWAINPQHFLIRKPQFHCRECWGSTFWLEVWLNRFGGCIHEASSMDTSSARSNAEMVLSLMQGALGCPQSLMLSKQILSRNSVPASDSELSMQLGGGSSSSSRMLVSASIISWSFYFKLSSGDLRWCWLQKTAHQRNVSVHNWARSPGLFWSFLQSDGGRHNSRYLCFSLECS